MNFKNHALIFVTANLLLGNIAFGDSNQVTKDFRSPILNKETDSLTAKFSTEYLSQDSEVSKTNRFRIKSELNFSKQLMKFLDFNLEAALYLETGNSDSLYQNANEFEPTNTINLKRGEFKFSPFDFAAVRAGAVNINNDDHRLLIGKNVFLGAAEELSFNYGEFSIAGVAYQTSPRNVNYSNRLDSVEEGDPNFFMESLKLKYGNENNFIAASYASFAFANLSNNVAGISYLHGNTVNLDGNGSGEFVYSYIGNSARLDAQLDSRYLKGNIFLEDLTNNSAPENNKGFLIGGTGFYHLGDSDIFLGYGNFRTEADATVAYYADPSFRRTNAKGQYTTIGFENKKEELVVEMTYIQSKEIIKSDLSEDSQEQIIQFSLRKVYDIF